MKKFLSILLALCITFSYCPIYASDSALSEYDLQANYAPEECYPLGYGSSRASSTAISTSMLAWGIGLAIVIAVVAGVIHRSTAAHSSSDTD